MKAHTTNSKRLFTPREAERTLPLVRRIVADILEKGRLLKAITSEGDLQDDAVLHRARNLRSEIARTVGELEALGCSFKDPQFEKGIVDFPALIGGREALLCWCSDEESIAWYHGVLEGYSGRKPIPPEALTEPSPTDPVR